MKKKLIGIFVCMLLIGTALPVTASYDDIISKASVNSDLVEISTEICGLNGGKHTVLLTKEKAEEVELLIDDIEKRLDEIETREEAVKIFYEAIVELYSYGLFSGLSAEKVQRLVYGRYNNLISTKVFENIYNENQASDDSNLLCLIAGMTDKTHFLSRHTSATETMMLIMFEFEEKLFKLTSNYPLIGWSLLILYIFS